MWFKTTRYSLRLPNLRLYQQILLSYLLVVLLPLLGLGVILYGINQTALKKEVSRFSEQSAKSLALEIEQQLDAEQRHARLLIRSLSGLKQLPLSWADNLRAEGYQLIAQYAATGKATVYLTPLAARQNRSVTAILPALHANTIKTLSSHIWVTHTQPGRCTLQLWLPASSVAATPAAAGASVARPAGWQLSMKCDAIAQLARRQQEWFTNGVLLVDSDGQSLNGSGHLTREDITVLNQLKPGHMKKWVVQGPHLPGAGEPDEDTPPLERVMVRVPVYHWGVVIESPYHLRQQYIQRARNQTFLLMLAYLTLVLIFGLFYVWGINRNFRQLLKATRALTQGNYSRRVWLISNATTPYEIIYLAAEFNRMARRMAESWQSVQQLNRELQEANRQLAKLDELKSNLIDTVSHELRTPLTSIKGYTSRLLRHGEDDLDPETRQKSLKIVKQQADRLSRLVEDLLVIPDLESERLRVYPDQVSLLPLVEACVAMVSDRLHRMIQVREAEPVIEPTLLLISSPITVLADPDRLEQIVLNLLDNAAKYSPEDSLITVGLFPQADATIEIQVINQAALIEPERLEQLFDKFTRLDDQLTRTTRGSGLGLYITKGLVEAMGGRIRLFSRADRFQVSFWLPLYLEPNR